MSTDKSSMIHKILIIDDNTAIHEDFGKILGKTQKANANLDDLEASLFGIKSQPVIVSEFEVEYASQGRDGLEKVRQAKAEGHPFSLIFVDGRMPPGWDGVETISYIWKEDPDVQMVLCTAYADYSWQELRRVLGESDSLLILKKPFDNMEVLQLAHALTRKWELNQEIQGRLNQLAFYDSLTGLPNRALFLERVGHALENASSKNLTSALLFIDLDNFKRINDTLGHTSGDRLLKKVSESIMRSLRSSDTLARALLARLGGDEFTVLLPEVTQVDSVARVAQRIADHMSQPMDIGGHQLIITPSIGIAIFPQDGADVETLLRNADMAMDYAKQHGPNAFKYFQDSMNSSALKRMTMENHLRAALKRNEFVLHYQPQFHLPSGTLSGMEALLRWNNADLGIVSPMDFVPLAEENGMIVAIGEWVLRTACAQTKAWMDQGLPLTRMAVNVSVKQFSDSNFINVVKAVLEDTQLPPSALEIEVTESHLEKNMDEIINALRELRSIGLRVAVDDFGNGYSSLSRLRDMPIDSLKIDRSFVWGMDNGPKNRAIVAAIVAMAKGMDLGIIAEGVETSQQADLLRDMDCREVQGYLYSLPLSTDQAAAFLQAQRLRHDDRQNDA